MKTVLVTGAAGFIGSHIVDELIENNYKAIAIDNLSSGKKEYVNKKAVFIKADVTNQQDLDKIFGQNKIDVIMHLAGQPSIVNAYADPYLDANTNFIGTMRMTLNAVKYGIPRFLYASSMTLYGNPKKLPIKEDDAAMPINYYGVAKFASERFVHITSERVDLKKPFNVTSLRMFNVYGPRQSLTNPYQGVLAIFLGNVLRQEPITIFGKGNQARDFVYVKDVARTWIDSIDNNNSFGKVFNIGFGKRTSILRLAKTVIKANGQNENEYPFVFKSKRSGDQQVVEADIAQAKKYLKFSPKFNLQQGLEKTIEWAKNNP